MAKTILQTAWLITWHSFHSSQPIEIAAVLNGNRADSLIKELVNQLWLAKQSPCERIRWAKFKREIPEPIRRSMCNQINMGHEPYLYARIVKNLVPDDSAPLGMAWEELDYQKRREKLETWFKT